MMVKLFKWMGIVLAGSLLATAALTVSPPTLAHAQEGPGGGEAAEKFEKALEEFYERLVFALDNQANRLARADEVVTKVGDWLDEQEAAGQDVSSIRDDYDNFVAALAEARGLHDQAASILSTHAGFDDSGVVTDREQATDTVRQAGRNIRDAHRVLSDAVIALRRAIVDFRDVIRDAQGQ